MTTSPNFASAFENIPISLPLANGRVDLFAPLNLIIPEYQRVQKDNKRFVEEATKGQVQRNELSDLFFSDLNINILQDGLRYMVYKETGQVIGRQSDTELKIVMRSIYFQYARHQRTDVVAQVKILNGYVLDWTVKEVVSNLRQQYKYQQDASQMPVPIDFGVYTSVKGHRQLEPMGKPPI